MNKTITNPRVLVAHLGARKHYQEPILFYQWGVLERFYTDLYAGHSSIAKLLRYPKVYNYLPNILKKSISRYDPVLEKAKITHFPSFAYQFFKRFRQTLPGETSGIFIWAGQEFCQRIIQSGIGNANIIYGFNWESLELFEYAKTQNIFCILDQTIAERSLVHKLLLEEEKNWSGWSIIPFSVSNTDMDLLQREQREQDLADRIICGSDFVRDSLIDRGISANKIFVVSLGRSKEVQKPQLNPNRKKPQGRKDGLRILFGGAVNLRKGIPYLLEALRGIKGKIPFTCKIAGSILIQQERISEYSDICEFLGRVPYSKMKELYTWADIFVFPSICEGSAMVVYEALSYGLPVITTYNSGSIVRDGIDGYIIPIRDSQALANKLLSFFEINTDLTSNNDFEKYTHHIYQKNLEILFQVINH